MRLNRFHEVIEQCQLDNSRADQMEQEMKVLQYFHDGVHRLLSFSDVDFNNFTYEDAEAAMESASYLVMSDHSDKEAAMGNRDNLLVQVARISHFKTSLESIRSSKRERKFF